MSSPDHACRFRSRAAWSAWERAGALRERTARRVPACEECGREQPARHPRPPVVLEQEAAAPELLPPADDAGRDVAAVLAARAGTGGAAVRARGLLGALAARGVPASVAESWLEQLMRSGLVRLARSSGGTRELRSVAVLDRAALDEVARPGERAARVAAVNAARAMLDRVEHPVADEVRRALAESEATISPDVARALAAVARHAADGDVLAERVFSARYLGSSKALGRLRDAVEQRLGRLEHLGIREGAALTLVGGSGRFLLEGGSVVDLAVTPPFLGLSRETASRVTRVELGPEGIVAVENLTVFDACCRGEIRDLHGATFVWTAGYPGRGVRAIIEAATRSGARVRGWCDLDLDGVRIARLVASWAGELAAYRMSPDDVRRAPTSLPLADRARRRIERELATPREDALTATLVAMLETGTWAEQESLVGTVRK